MKPRPWLFGVAAMPYGSFNGLVAVALPYILRRHGLTVDRIASIAAMVQAPAIWYFLWAPVVDVRWRRRTWIIALSAATAVCVALAIDVETGAVARLSLLLVAASVFAQPISTALGGFVAAVVPDDVRGRTGGWSQAGILTGGAVAGGLMVWLDGWATPISMAAVAAVMTFVPALAALTIDEPPPADTPLVRHLADMWRDVRATLTRRDVWLGMVFFLSPIGAGALTNLFSAVTTDFHATGRQVIWIVVLASVVTPAGAIVGGIVCDRFDRWRVYAAAGLLAAIAPALMSIAPLSAATYVIGAAAYSMATGFCYAAFMALAFELVGAASAASGTRFTLFMAAVNLPVMYMLRVDGWGHAHFGVRGMLGVDALSNALFGALFLAAMWRRTGWSPATVVTAS